MGGETGSCQSCFGWHGVLYTTIGVSCRAGKPEGRAERRGRLGFPKLPGSPLLPSRDGSPPQRVRLGKVAGGAVGPEQGHGRVRPRVAPLEAGFASKPARVHSHIKPTRSALLSLRAQVGGLWRRGLGGANNNHEAHSATRQAMPRSSGASGGTSSSSVVGQVTFGKGSGVCLVWERRLMSLLC